MRNEFYRESNALLLVYDVTNKKSFDAFDMWLREVSKFGGEALPVFVCGTKCDLSSKRIVSTQDGEDWTKSRSFGGFFEVSPMKTGDTSVKEMFIKISK